ncbi:MAG: ACT domain-containing protein, partial [Chloroflexota bacterium]
AALLRGLLERVTTERVNLVNAALLAKARGITVIERRSPDAGSFSALVTVSGTVDGGAVSVGGTVANGEPRIVLLNEYRLDMAPSDVMLITRHHDEPGIIGRVGGLLGAADVNISAMHVARSTPRADALMVLALDDDVPDSLAASIRDHEALIDLWTIRLGNDR